MSCNEKRISSEGGRPIQALSSQFYSEWWQFGAPRPMKMGNIASPWRYDLLAGTPIRYPNIRCHSPVRYA